MTKITEETFKGNLKRSNKSIQAARATRICAVAKMEYETLVNEKKKEIFNQENELEMMADISTSNVTTTANAIKGVSFDAKAFVVTRAKIKDELVVLNDELKSLVDDAKFYE